MLDGAAGMLFTGDALLIMGCGRTDFQQGNAGKATTPGSANLHEALHTPQSYKTCA